MEDKLNQVYLEVKEKLENNKKDLFLFSLFFGGLALMYSCKKNN